MNRTIVDSVWVFLGCEFMPVLVVENNSDLAKIWASHLRRMGPWVDIAATADEATDALIKKDYRVVVLDLDLPDGSALGLADIISYRHPMCKVVLVTKSTFFSDGSIFRNMPNACGFLSKGTNPHDLAALVTHHMPDQT